MIKIFLIIVLVALIIYIAKGVAKQYSDKLEFYKNLKNFFDIYKLNIGFKKDKLKEIVLNFSSKGDAQILFKNYLEFLENSKDLTCETTLICFSPPYYSMYPIGAWGITIRAMI